MLYKLSRSLAGISYDNVTKQIKPFSAEVQNNVNLAPKNKSKGQQTHITIDSSDGRQTHITIDSSDGRQQTLTGLNTIHATVYKPKK